MMEAAHATTMNSSGSTVKSSAAVERNGTSAKAARKSNAMKSSAKPDGKRHG